MFSNIMRVCFMVVQQPEMLALMITDVTLVPLHPYIMGVSLVGFYQT